MLGSVEMQYAKGLKKPLNLAFKRYRDIEIFPYFR